MWAGFRELSDCVEWEKFVKGVSRAPLILLNKHFFQKKRKMYLFKRIRRSLKFLMLRDLSESLEPLRSKKNVL